MKEGVGTAALALTGGPLAGGDVFGAALPSPEDVADPVAGGTGVWPVGLSSESSSASSFLCIGRAFAVGRMAGSESEGLFAMCTLQRQVRSYEWARLERARLL